MRLVYKFYIRHTDELDRLFRISNNLYNQALYLFRQRLDADGVWTWYNDMDKLIKGVTNLEGECNYKLLKSQCSQQILRVLDKNMKAYCKSIKDWKKHPEKYKATFFLDIEYPELGGLATDVLENELGDKPVQCVTYTDIAGRVSTRPFNGLNIVVTHYTDGTSKVIKKIYR